MSLALGLRFSRQAQVHVEHSAVQWQCSVCNRTYLNIFRVIWGDRKTANFDEHMAKAPTGELRNDISME